MSIETAERLKRDLTDKYVVVASGVPELKRFVGLTGLVKTVNMNGHALVQFDGPVDISWYDIDPEYLTVVDEPIAQKETPAKSTPSTTEKKPAATPKTPAKPTAGKSPLELAREQGAADSVAKPSGGKKLSPLELARQQGAAKKDSAGTSTPPSASTEAKSPAEGKKLSPLEMARSQGAFKDKDGDEPAPSTPEPKPTPSEPEKKLSPLELARQQGGFKGGEESSDTPQESSEASAPDATSSAADESTSEADQEAATDNSEPAQSQTPTTGPDGRPLSPLELARLQGPYKG